MLQLLIVKHIEIQYLNIRRKREEKKRRTYKLGHKNQSTSNKKTQSYYLDIRFFFCHIMTLQNVYPGCVSQHMHQTPELYQRHQKGSMCLNSFTILHYTTIVFHLTLCSAALLNSIILMGCLKFANSKHTHHKKIKLSPNQTLFKHQSSQKQNIWWSAWSNPSK